MKLTQQLVQDLLEYHPDTGRFFWKNRANNLFKSEKAAKIWNKRFAGKEAFITNDGAGYKQASIFYKNYRAHRIAFLWMVGFIPEEIDHDNHDRSDNRWVNLIASDKSANSKNMSLSKRNTTGYTGVYLNKARNKFRAEIMNNGIRERLGLFLTAHEANIALIKRRAELGFSKNHGAVT